MNTDALPHPTKVGLMGMHFVEYDSFEKFTMLYSENPLGKFPKVTWKIHYDILYLCPAGLVKLKTSAQRVFWFKHLPTSWVDPSSGISILSAH